MKIVFERDEIVSIEKYSKSFGEDYISIKLMVGHHRELFEKSVGIEFDAELNLSDNEMISGCFFWSHNVNGYCYIVSSGELTTSISEKPDNNKSLRRIEKIQKQIDRLKIELSG